MIIGNSKFDLFKLAAIRHNGEPGIFSTEDYIRVCASVYATPKLLRKDARKHMLSSDYVRQVADNIWKVVA